METDSATKPPWNYVQWQSRILSPLKEVRFGEWRDEHPNILRTAKDRISALEEIHRWELVKKMVNPYEMVYTHEDVHFHPSISVIKPLSRSYFKLIEILDVLQFFDNLPKQMTKIRSAHIAEGPGGFIQACTDVAQRKKKTIHNATAMTLRPTNQRVPGWRRASSFLQSHREVRLHYGADGTGDIYVEANRDSFVAAVSPGAILFTADGGFDFSINYHYQEKSVYKLLVNSALTGLRCLQSDGCFVLKLFDIFSESTIVLIGLLGRCFKEWTLYKPAISRPCNSERYFLGRGCMSGLQDVLTFLQMIVLNIDKDIYPIDSSDVMGPTECSYVRSHVRIHMEQQCNAISTAEQYAIHPEIWYDTQLMNDFRKSLAWCQRFHIPYIITKPIAVHPVVYTSAPSAYRQLPLLGGDLKSHSPCDPTLSTLSAVCLDQNLDQSQSQTDGDSHEQTRGAVP
ncbi:MAG: hypothetical protein EBU66_11380 [Bacteroidetes bacterium]|nr:hypothetical protein [bacterium]NBP65242.1 hypothetical protein [Bacteroidota bacterium]